MTAIVLSLSSSYFPLEGGVVHLRFRFHFLVLIIGAFGLFIVACGGDAPSAAPTAATTSSAATNLQPTTVVVAVTPVSIEPTTTPIPEGMIEGEPALVTFTMTAREVKGPEFIPAGLTTIRLQNDDTVDHAMIVFDVDEGHTIDEVESKLEGQTWPWVWAPPLGQVRAGPGETNELTVRLEKGLYAVTDWTTGPDNIPHVAKGVFTSFQVTEAEVQQVEWDSDAIEIGLDDFAFTGLKDLEAGMNTFRLTNNSDDQEHELLFVPLLDGQSAEELFKDFAYSWNGGTLEFEIVAGIDWIGPGLVVEYSVDIDPGEYAVVDLIPESYPGTPHVNMGMVEQITVK
jgi:hypothetical protein